MEAIRSLENSLRWGHGKPLRPSAYGRIRYDLHPVTKSLCVRRFLSAISEFPHATVVEARDNLQKDAGDALSMARDAAERSDLI